MKKFFLIIPLIFGINVSYAQGINFLWIKNEVNNLSLVKTDIRNYDFVLITSSKVTSLSKMLNETIPDSIPVIYFPDASYRDFLIQSFLNDGINLQRRFSYSKNGVTVLGLNYKLNKLLNYSGLLPEDENWLRENLTVNKNPKRLYIVACGFEKENNLLDIPGSLLPKETYFIFLNTLESKYGKSPVLQVELKNNSILIKKKRINNIKLASYKAAFKNKLERGISNLKIIQAKQNNSFTFNPPLIDGNNFYTTNINGIVSCLDSTGNTIWDYDAMGTIISQPVILKNFFIFTTLEGDVVILDKTSGEQIESLGVDDAIVSGPVLFTYTGNKELLYSNGSGKTGAVAFATSSGSIYAYSVPAFEELWVNEDNNSGITGDVINANNKIIFFNSKGILHNIDPATGWTIWKWQEKSAPAKLISNFLVEMKNLFFVLSNNKLYKMDLLLGKRLWKIKSGKISGRIAFDYHGNIFFTTSNGLKTVSHKSGKVLKNIKVRENNSGLSSNLVFSGNDVYFGSKNGKIYRLTNGNKISTVANVKKPVSYTGKKMNNIFTIIDYFNNFNIINLH